MKLTIKASNVAFTVTNTAGDVIYRHEATQYDSSFDLNALIADAKPLFLLLAKLKHTVREADHAIALDDTERDAEQDAIRESARSAREAHRAVLEEQRQRERDARRDLRIMENCYLMKHTYYDYKHHVARVFNIAPQPIEAYTTLCILRHIAAEQITEAFSDDI